MTPDRLEPLTFRLIIKPSTITPGPTKYISLTSEMKFDKKTGSHYTQVLLSEYESLFLYNHQLTDLYPMQSPTTLQSQHNTKVMVDTF